MANTVEEAVVRKTVRVQAPIERAFSVFVEQMETWWPATHHIGKTPFEAIFVEPRVGGRWYERNVEGNQCDWGTVLAWDPPHRVTFSRGTLVRGTINRIGRATRTWPGRVKSRFDSQPRDREQPLLSWSTASWSATARAMNSCARSSTDRAPGATFWRCTPKRPWRSIR